MAGKVAGGGGCASARVGLCNPGLRLELRRVG